MSFIANCVFMSSSLPFLPFPTLFLFQQIFIKNNFTHRRKWFSSHLKGSWVNVSSLTRLSVMKEKREKAQDDTKWHSHEQLGSKKFSLRWITNYSSTIIVSHCFFCIHESNFSFFQEENEYEWMEKYSPMKRRERRKELLSILLFLRIPAMTVMSRNRFHLQVSLPWTGSLCRISCKRHLPKESRRWWKRRDVFVVFPSIDFSSFISWQRNLYCLPRNHFALLPNIGYFYLKCQRSTCFISL